jgi:tRNA pseudouridine55 synthase
MATGVLVLGIERGTKLLTYVVGVDKTYRATIRLGIGTVSDDAQGEVNLAPGLPAELSEARIKDAVQAFTGEIDQVPSAVSAIKVDGRRAYARVRSGEQVVLEPRRVTVSRFEVLGIGEPLVQEVDGGIDPDVDQPEQGDAATASPRLSPRLVAVLDLDVEVDCSSGTYIRALARDLGAALGSAGHLTALRRTRVGPFNIEEARQLEGLDTPPELLGLGQSAGRLMPVRAISADEARNLGYGRSLSASHLGPDPVAAVDGAGGLVAVLSDRAGTARPQVVFAGGPDV